MINDVQVMLLVANEALRRNQAINLTTIPVRVSDLATRRGDSKVKHKKRWFHTEAHHRRKQADLDFRYGFHWIPSLYLVDPTKTNDPQVEDNARLHFNQVPYLLVHPMIRPVLQKLIDQMKVEQALTNLYPNEDSE